MKTTMHDILTKLVFTVCSIVFLQSCAHQECDARQAHTTAKQVLANSASTVTEEEMEQAAALLILAAVTSEADQVDYSNDNNNEGNYTEDERQRSVINDVVETNLSDNIVYE